LGKRHASGTDIFPIVETNKPGCIATLPKRDNMKFFARGFSRFGKTTVQIALLLSHFGKMTVQLGFLSSRNGKIRILSASAFPGSGQGLDWKQFLQHESYEHQYHAVNKHV
jgi:hypothetical protein